MIPRLHVFTGKGGVGKTTLALATCRELERQGKKVRYNSFDVTHPQEAEDLNLSYFDLDLEQSATEYMGRKLRSETVAHWIMKTPFFNALFAMLPGLGQMILLGHVIDQLEQDPELHIVLDSPASGHTLSMFESTHNFHEMFKTGILANDIVRMHKFLGDPEFMQIVVVALPTLMAVQEGKELVTDLKALGLPEPQMWLNNSWIKNHEIQSAKESELPEFLAKKIQFEHDLLSKEDFLKILPHIASAQFVDVVKSLEVNL